ncbi:hypothetical protein Scep_003776 [Stephania cephalantha]|uniref:Uncharacterized protein n=1 Tax=Stephania cephalantha TaxID=152367 RepID=A0AAP0KT36_9MAGN
MGIASPVPNPPTCILTSEDDDHDDEDQDDGDVSGGEGTSVEIKYIDSGVEGDESVDGESEENEGVAIDDHVVRDLTKEDVKDRSGGEDIMGTPLEVALIEDEQPPMEHEHEPIGTSFEAALMEHGTGGEDIMGEVALMEQPSTDVKKLTDVLTKYAGDASYGLNLLHGDMETMLIRAQDLMEKTDQPRKVVADFMERFNALLGKYEEKLRQREMRKKWKRTWKPGHIDLDALTLSLLIFYLIN